ncbi:hypothetical protein HDV01_006209 [Terramyces sp. JEL0728]|nr:hypothetical protein HDV01_006209 [Terramyces sp. JEL0728]
MCGGSKNPDGPAAVAPQKVEGNGNNGKADGKPSELTPTTAVLKRQPTKKFLEAILQSKELSQALESFLQAEFCLENLLFIQRSGNYREEFKKSDLENPEHRQKLEQLRAAIMSDFMLPTSERENPDGPASVDVKSPDNSDAKRLLSNGGATLRRQPSTKKFLESILQSKELSQALESFLQAEFCLENLLFIQKTGEYKELLNHSDLDSATDREKLEEFRAKILANFMLPASEKEVNIPAKIKRDCLIGLEQLKAKGMKMESEEYKEMAGKVYEQCENHIKTVLVQDRIGKFQDTPAFQQAAANIQLPE